MNQSGSEKKNITVAVKNYSQRRAMREHQNNIMKEIYSPARNDRRSIIIKKGMNSFNQTLKPNDDFLGDKVDREEPTFKKKKIKINLNDQST